MVKQDMSKCPSQINKIPIREFMVFFQTEDTTLTRDQIKELILKSIPKVLPTTIGLLFENDCYKGNCHECNQECFGGTSK